MDKKNSVQALLGIFNKLSLQQRLIIGGVVLATVILLGFILFAFNEPNYSALFTNLAPEDASKVVEHLTSQKIPYKIEDNGQTIRVPKEKVYETRLALAGKGIPSSGIVGYEIFDKNTMGMSEFMQKLNFKRALEGELARTIMQVEGVEGVRVHIVFPQKSVFKEEEKEPTASVVLKLRNSQNITKNNIVAISNLISGSVEGLRPGKVTILDTHGRLLSKELDESPLAASSSKQYEIKQSVENYLAQKAQSLLDNVLGYGNAIVQVNADLDFNQVEKTMETYDPESQVAVSEQTVKSSSGGKASGDSTQQSNENATTNYEISRTVQKVVEGTGTIKRLSLAAVINGTPKEVKKGENTEIVYEPRSDDQMKKLENIIKNSIGIDSTRKDQFSIVSIPFETKMGDDTKGGSSIFDNMDKWTNLLLIFVAVGASMFILKGLLNKIKNERIIIGTVGESADVQLLEMPSVEAPQTGNQPALLKKKKAPAAIGDIEDEITEDAAQKLVQQEKIANYVAKNPADAAKLINSWLHEDEY
ncbi:MAG: flagellar basal-body MS-ring/collar protein FliF [Bacteroidota bacterium]|nr:flagellar M-ring protein FliF [Ignavibacteria bacterium]HEX2960365.1 flagellar basal-body MS-ring/collar protein FliF [Ignavibacteriales bacterium]MCU7499301.1 flagellar M-ring protein FliF [Ignavibacteria bacterium]MCU7512530.1 flagellar M-ring protein FliF [Ignavibacteria bacterium]MCU7519692.1 flagellar M-ring protein FliF [Ignavibacteria bacterium]